jgi:anti-sigma-K factor RskA
MFRHHDLHTLTGSYVLDALDGSERERFERHLRRCPSCAAEVRGLRETAARLAMAAAAQPPAPLRERVLAAAGRTRQLPPATAGRSRGRRGRAWMPRLSLAVAAVSAAAAVILGITQATTSSQLGQAQARSRAVAAVLAAPDARIAAGTTSAGGTVTAVVSGRRREAVITTAGLPVLAGRRVYQLWFMGPGGTRSAGLLPAAQAGRTEPVLASGLSHGDRMGITVEPAGGTVQPTTIPITIMPLPA